MARPDIIRHYSRKPQPVFTGYWTPCPKCGTNSQYHAIPSLRVRVYCPKCGPCEIAEADLVATVPAPELGTLFPAGVERESFPWEPGEYVNGSAK
jgi:predicted nucleic-acid-binding Zn-ribbon protein